ncbi:MAG TPA: DUF2889 domain-containing protein [Rhodocyclaceae bacterium]|jgi:hypothetical protein|nr:DUF2889 domain-containing protein [Rhodocyclaceae bacterium]
MPLSPSPQREAIHRRHITCEGFRRPDGLIEIEGHITDIRPFPYHGHWDGEIVDGSPVHEMWLRLVINEQKTIVDVETAMDHTPFPSCLDVTTHYKRLVGLTIGPGMAKQVFKAVGGTEGCTHVTGLIQTMATTLFQALASEATRILPDTEGLGEEALMQQRMQKVSDVFADSAEPGYPLLNTCYSHASDGVVVKRLAPKFHKPK